MSDIPTMDEEPKGCPSCQAVAATWIGGCDNPIHIHQANAHILHLEQQLATAQAAVWEEAAKMVEGFGGVALAHQKSPSTIAQYLFAQAKKAQP